MKKYHIPFKSLFTRSTSKSIHQFAQSVFIVGISLSFVFLLSCSNDDDDKELSEYELAKASFET